MRAATLTADSDRASTAVGNRASTIHGNRSGRQDRRGGFSLLEVILALAILTGVIAVLGELARLGLENARIARDLTYAQLLSESKMAEITAGITLPDPTPPTPFGTVADPREADWLYSIEVEPIDQEGLLAVRVSVVQDLPEEKRPVEFSLTRWIVDPSVELSEATAAETPDSSRSETGGGL